ncbi:DUF4136 domain-containing protein [Spirosoma sp. KUDC1026]|uniref:DUF4136 domain-containing protein n=1 Tax=Spirosoma sp. KUDC1026 TaxID=2745947 RepID=UPI00159BEFC9|nr:DUF4136 domain-containing protein [Spirosoma sp. KUDC1026]QKZ12625.1 DUF4136 domain-containing protein [Spirosoma sp. KUDC1026]
MNTLEQFKQSKVSLIAALLLILGGGLTACRDNALDNLSPEDSKVYITNYDRSVNFAQYRTFSMPDSVVIESNDGYRPALGALESSFTSGVASALTSRGFQRVSRGQSADLGVAVIRVDNQYTGVGVDPYAYYGGYWGGGFGGFGGLGGFYPYYPSYYTYQVAEKYWEIQVVDLKNRPTASTGNNQTQLNVIYNASIRGTDITDTQAINTALAAIFAQSPYLTTTR